MIHIHTSQTSKNSCSIVISHPYYTSFTPTYIVVVVVVVIVDVTVITHYIHPYYNCLPNLVIYHQSIIPTCTAISHPYLHSNLTSLPTYIHCCHSCCCYTHTIVVVAHDAPDGGNSSIYLYLQSMYFHVKLRIVLPLLNMKIQA